MNHINNSTILEGLKHKDNSTLRYLSKKYRTRIMSIGRKYGCDKMEIEEVFSITLMDLCKKASLDKIYLDKPHSLDALIYKMVKNQCLKLIKRRKTEEWKDDAAHAVVETDEDYQDEEMNRKKILADALSKISEECRKLLHDFYLDEKSYNELGIEYISNTEFALMFTEKWDEKRLQYWEQIQPYWEYFIEVASIRFDHNFLDNWKNHIDLNPHCLEFDHFMKKNNDYWDFLKEAIKAAGLKPKKKMQNCKDKIIRNTKA